MPGRGPDDDLGFLASSDRPVDGARERRRERKSTEDKRQRLVAAVP